MVSAIGCGPFDGGCVTFAMALQQAHGGEVYVICGSHRGPHFAPKAQHAVLRLPSGDFMDFGTVGTGEEIIAVFNKEECMGRLSSASLRPIADDDLDEAPRDLALIDDIVRILLKPPRNNIALAP